MVASGKAVANSRRLWEQADRIRVLKGRLQDAGTYRLPTRRLTSGYHLSAALRQIGVFKQLLSLGALVTKYFKHTHYQ